MARPFRKDCTCPCHGPWGDSIRHIVACCRADPELEIEPYNPDEDKEN
jgi:hypothetical protein